LYEACERPGKRAEARRKPKKKSIECDEFEDRGRWKKVEFADSQDIQARLAAQLGDATDSLRGVQCWRQYARQRREFLGDEPRSGRLLIDFLDIRILTCAEKQSLHSAYSLPEMLNVWHMTILNHLHDDLGMKLFHLR
jgi:hypothetical protein